jgi:phage anti-repressor protein
MLKHTIEDGEQRLRIEQKIIRESVIRLNWIVAMISKMKGNVLVFFLDKKTGYGRKIMEKVKEKAPMKEVYYVDGDVKKDLREIYKDKMEEGDNKVLVASYDTYSTGKSIKNLHYIVCAESRKGEIVVNQATGRGMRLHHTKDICLWIDIVDDFSINIENYENKNYILRHLSDRIGYYDKWGFERETIEITLDNDGAFGTGIVDAPRL